MPDVEAMLTRLGELRELRARQDAEEVQLLASLHAADRSGKEYLREEVARVLRWSFEMTRSRMHEAVTLRTQFADTLIAMGQGELSYPYARALLELTAPLSTADAARVQARVLPRVGQKTTSEFRAALRRAVARYDTRGEQERHEQARSERRVCVNPEPAGMAALYAPLTAPDAQAIWDRCQAVAAAQPADGRTMDQKRADALVDLCLDTSDDAASGDSPKQPGRNATVFVTVPLATLTGASDLPGELAGYGPIPAAMAREIAADPTSTWRRLLTDPAGRILDYGHTTYHPPAALREYVIARDRTCRMPGCNRRARSCDLDHVIPYSRGGPTNAANLHCLCPRHHALKHEAGWHVQRLPDGTTRWTTPTGRVHDKPPDETVDELIDDLPDPDDDDAA